MLGSSSQHSMHHTLGWLLLFWVVKSSWQFSRSKIWFGRIFHLEASALKQVCFICKLARVRMGRRILNDALRTMVNAERRGMAKAHLQPISTVMTSFLKIMKDHGKNNLNFLFKFEENWKKNWILIVVLWEFLKNMTEEEERMESF